MKYAIASIAALMLPFGAYAQTEAQSLETSPLTILTNSGETNITVELADEPEELATGLMHRTGVPEGTGMLFDFGDPREANMYMRNVPFGLDMLFLNTEGEVMAIVAYVQPYSERTINPGFPVKGVLELAAGEAGRLGVKPGDKIVHAMFETSAETEAPMEE